MLPIDDSAPRVCMHTYWSKDSAKTRAVPGTAKNGCAVQNSIRNNMQFQKIFFSVMEFGNVSPKMNLLLTNEFQICILIYISLLAASM